MSKRILRRGVHAAKTAPWIDSGGGGSLSLGALLPARLAQSAGSITNVSTQAALESALGSVANGSIINITANIDGGGSQLAISRVASAVAPITITSSPGVLITNFSQWYTTGQYLRFKGLNIGYNALAGIKFDGTANHNEIVGCTIHHGGRMGILCYTQTYSDDIQIWDNTIYLNGSISNGSLDHGIYWGTQAARSGSYGGVIANNLAYDNCAFNIQIYPASPWIILTCNTVDGGMIHANQRGGVVYGSNDATYPHDTISVGMLITNAPNWGIELSGCGNPNYLYDSLGYGNAAGNLSGGSPQMIATNYTSADPLYVNRTAKDYHIQAGSPAISKIQAARYGYIPPLDKDGNARITADAGCYRA